MKPDIVADIGNSRIKWGFCSPDGVSKMVSLTPDVPEAWRIQLAASGTSGARSWILAGVHPERLTRFAEWLQQRGFQVRILSSWKDLSIQVSPDPDRVGLDRLLNAVAAKDRVKREVSIFIVDAGSAVTVDWVDETGTFRGGAIFPGFRLMTKALSDYTAKLPLVEMHYKVPLPHGTSTEQAIEAGVFWAVAGGIKAILRQMMALTQKHEEAHATGDEAERPGCEAHLLPCSSCER